MYSTFSVKLGEKKVLLGAKLNPLPDGLITTKNGDYIVLTTNGDMILTVNGFVPLNAMRTITGLPVVTKTNDYILT